MEEENKRPKRKWWRRILAVLLIVTLVASPIVLLKTQIRFSREKYVEDTAAYAAQVTEDKTGYLTEKRLSRAWKYLTTLVKEPETYHDYELYASIAIARNDFDSAAKYLEGCLDTADGENGDPAVLNLRLASLFILEEQPDMAAGYLDKAIELDPDLTSAYYLRGQVRAQQGDTEGAVEDLRKFVLQPDADPAVSATLAPLFDETGDAKTAMICYTAGINSSEDPDPGLYRGRAKCFILQGDMATARMDLEKYFSLTDEDPEGQASAMLATCLMDSEDYTGAADCFSRALENGYADQALLYEQIMMCRYAAEEYEAAAEAGEKVIEAAEQSGKDSTEAHFWTGMSLMALGQYGDAYTHLDSAKDGDPDREDIHYYLGVCALANEEMETAADEFTASIEKDESTAASLYNRAICYIRLNKAEEAEEDLKKAAEREDDPEVAADAKELLEALQEAMEQAMEMTVEEAAAVE